MVESWTAERGGWGRGGTSSPVFAKFLQNLLFLPQILAFLCLQPPHVPVSPRTFKFTPPSLRIMATISKLSPQIFETYFRMVLFHFYRYLLGLVSTYLCTYYLTEKLIGGEIISAIVQCNQKASSPGLGQYLIAYDIK